MTFVWTLINIITKETNGIKETLWQSQSEGMQHDDTQHQKYFLYQWHVPLSISTKMIETTSVCKVAPVVR